MTNESIEATPRSVRDTLRKAYKETTDFDGELFNALFAALTMLEKMEARIDTLEAARPTATPQVLYEGEAAVLKHGLLLSTLAMRGHKRVHIVVTALEDDES